MNNINFIQNAIMQLEGGAFQKLFDAYLYKKYKFNNIQTLGVQTGTNKTTKGTPDAYVLTDDKKYILINYGTVSSQSAKKIRDDILSCYDKSKLLLPKDKIKKIICGYCSTNIHIEQFDSIMGTIEGVEIELIGIDTLSHDLAFLYPHIAKDELGIEIDTELYLEVLKSYFDAKAPFSLNGYRQIKYLLDHIGYEATYCFINNEVFAKKDEWMAFIWECMPEETIDEKIINDYKTFVFNNLAKDKPIVPAVQVVARYCERDSKLKAVVIKAVLTNPQMSANFLSYVYDDVAVEGIINFFENDIIALASIYMSAIENNCHIDYDGKLFKRIFEQHPTVWNEYVDWIKSKDTMCGDGNEHKIIELIWGDDKWRECVEYAFKVLIDDDVIFHIKEPADMLFTNTTDETILERKKYWLIEKLRETSLELKKCKKLIEMVVNVLPDWKLEYILEFLKINKNPEDFKEIPLFPSSYSWSGSEIPLIMEKIDFLKSLKDNIKGINFIEHRKYIEEYRMNLERYKDNVELREYLENADYA